MFALVDGNNFYVSCERVFNPKLHGKPVVVLSNNDGCVISRSNEAKSLGIKMGEPAFQLENLFKKHDVKIYSANFPLYGDMSQRMHDTLRTFSEEMEIYSIDEAFLSFPDLDNPQEYVELGEKIKKTIRRNLGLPVGIGIAKTRTLAKVANHLAKKIQKYDNVCALYSQEEINKALKLTPVEDIWGVGRRFAAMLKSYGIATAHDFVGLSEDWVKSKMTISGLKTLRELKGFNEINLDDLYVPKKSISTTRTFGRTTSDFDLLQTAVATFASNCAENLRKQNSVASFVTVFLRTNKHREDLPQYRNSQTLALPVATSDTFEIVKYANLALRKIFRPNFEYKRAGVFVTGIENKNSIQPNLFYDYDFRKSERIMRVLEKINARYGKNTLRVASVSPSETWRIRNNSLSPRYTTEWNEILKIGI